MPNKYCWVKHRIKDVRVSCTVPIELWILLWLSGISIEALCSSSFISTNFKIFFTLFWFYLACQLLTYIQIYKKFRHVSACWVIPGCIFILLLVPWKSWHIGKDLYLSSAFLWQSSLLYVESGLKFLLAWIFCRQTLEMTHLFNFIIHRKILN